MHRPVLLHMINKKENNANCESRSHPQNDFLRKRGRCKVSKVARERADRYRRWMLERAMELLDVAIKDICFADSCAVGILTLALHKQVYAGLVIPLGTWA